MVVGGRVVVVVARGGRVVVVVARGGLVVVVVELVVVVVVGAGRVSPGRTIAGGRCEHRHDGGDEHGGASDDGDMVADNAGSPMSSR